uniref:Uncharacterized protein n=1 Tax=Rhizophagus irregularis (strain DAOM 181602 / DAOM 197198 / MUCL 43194) TaxID=747089 RepID=U9UVL3_RHIID
MYAVCLLLRTSGNTRILPIILFALISLQSLFQKVIISKYETNKEIEAPTNIKIINITGQKTVLLKWVDKHQRYQVYVNMIVTNSAEYNVLFENEWLKMDNANIDYADYSDNSWETFGYFVGHNEKSGDDQAKVISARGSGTGFETMSTHGGSLGPGSFLLLCGIVNDVIRFVSDSEPTTNTPYPICCDKIYSSAYFLKLLFSIFLNLYCNVL